MTILNKDAMKVTADLTDAFGASVPTTEAGLEKQANQTGIFIFSKTNYDLYLKNAAGAWVKYGTISGARESITVPWGENTAAFFKCADATATMHVHRKTGAILYDSTPENDNDDQNALLVDATTLAQAASNYTFPAADGTADQVLTTDGAGTVTWADGSADCAASSFTFDGHIIPDTNEAYDLGSADKKVRHLFLSDNSIKFESGDLGVDGGDLTWKGAALGGGGGFAGIENASNDMVLTMEDNGKTIFVPPIASDTMISLPAAPSADYKISVVWLRYSGSHYFSVRTGHKDERMYGIIQRLQRGDTGYASNGLDMSPQSYAGADGNTFHGAPSQHNKNRISVIRAGMSSKMDLYWNGTYWILTGIMVSGATETHTQFHYDNF